MVTFLFILAIFASFGMIAFSAFMMFKELDDERAEMRKKHKKLCGFSKQVL